MSNTPEIQSANETYAASFEKGHLPMPPGRRFMTFSNEELQEQLGTDIEFLPFSDPDESVRASVERVRESPICGESVHGFVYDVETGRLREVA